MSKSAKDWRTEFSALVANLKVINASLHEQPQHKQGVLIEEANLSVVTTPQNLAEFRRVLNAPRLVKSVPATCGKLKVCHSTIWMDKEGVYSNQHKNTLASMLVGEQVCGGVLYGPVLVCPGDAKDA